MKNTIKLKVIQRIAAFTVLVTLTFFSMTACSTTGGSTVKAATETGSGAASASTEPSTLTITGLDKWNGMFIMVKTRGLDAEGIQAGARIVERVSPFHGGKEQAVEGVRIANGRASLTVWSNGWIPPENVGISGDHFIGSEEKDNLEFIIWSSEDGIWEWSSRDNDIIKVFAEWQTLEFTDGGATFNGSNLPPYDPNYWD